MAFQVNIEKNFKGFSLRTAFESTTSSTGILGASGSGKSTLAREIRDSLTCSAVIIGQDCYYKNHAHLPFEERVRINYDEPAIFDYDEMLRDVEALAAGARATTMPTICAQTPTNRLLPRMY